MADEKQIDHGGPAFPVQNANYTEAYGGAPGMSLRDWFAGQALVGLMAMPDGPNGNFHNNCQDLGGYAYEVADKLLSARKGGAK